MQEQAVWVTVDEAMHLIGIGRNLLYDLINEKRLKSIKIGRRRLISVESIRTLESDPPTPVPTGRRRSGSRIAAVV
jgi:excisionase family DNA binding protein